MGISQDQVVWVYRTFLRRDPENEELVAQIMCNCNSRVDLILSVMESEEFITDQSLSRRDGNIQ